MTATDTVLDRTDVATLDPETGTVPAPEAAAGSAGRATSLAVGLWVVVGSLLAYGVLQTALKASALFG